MGDVAAERDDDEQIESSEAPENLEQINSLNMTSRPQRQRRPPQRLGEELGRQADIKRQLDRAAIAYISQEDPKFLTPSSYREAVKDRRW